jgi:hypothetical protein
MLSTPHLVIDRGLFIPGDGMKAHFDSAPMSISRSEPFASTWTKSHGNRPTYLALPALGLLFHPKKASNPKPLSSLKRPTTWVLRRHRLSPFSDPLINSFEIKSGMSFNPKNMEP